MYTRSGFTASSTNTVLTAPPQTPCGTNSTPVSSNEPARADEGEQIKMAAQKNTRNERATIIGDET
jgi:hypothetical protein